MLLGLSDTCRKIVFNIWFETFILFRVTNPYPYITVDALTPYATNAFIVYTSGKYIEFQNVDNPDYSLTHGKYNIQSITIRNYLFINRLNITKKKRSKLRMHTICIQISYVSSLCMLSFNSAIWLCGWIIQ